VADGSGDRRDLGGGFFKERCDRGIDGGWVDERFVTLDVDEDVSFLVRGHFGDALGAGAVIDAGHARLATEGADGVHNALVVSGYHDVMDGLGLSRALVDSLDHGLAGERNQRLAGQAGGSITRGDDHYDSWFVGTHQKFPGGGATLPMLAQSSGWCGTAGFLTS
jgi:hypothetical protein